MRGSDRLTRRQLLERAAVASAGAAVLGGCGSTSKPAALRATTSFAPPPQPADPISPAPAPAPDPRPNVLVILVDQLRQPRWHGARLDIDALLPTLSQLTEQSVSFEHHYTAANDCTPSRSALLTGLYTHQTGCVITGDSTLSPLFPTYGSLMREQGYDTWWYGKWHLTNGDNLWFVPTDRHSLLRYGFQGGTYPSPDGGPNQGLHVDPQIATQFETWLGQHGDQGPWCTTVSFVNPHDIAFWYRYTNLVAAKEHVLARFDALPPNFETPAQLTARAKPRAQLGLQDSAARAFGAVPFEGPDAVSDWTDMLDTYLRLQQLVDAQIGRVLSALRSRPGVASNTIVIFTSDHGEYGGAHGLRGKGAAAYEEAINVPLLVNDPRGELAADIGHPRTQMTSSVDIAPLLLTIAHGSDDWRNQPRYSHLAERPDLAAICRDRRAPGRRVVLHATDEVVTEYDTEQPESRAPVHIVGCRTETGKYVTYSHWSAQTPASATDVGQEAELYLYDTEEGQQEVDNFLGPPVTQSDHRGAARAVSFVDLSAHARQARALVGAAHERTMGSVMQRAVADELQRPLPRHLRSAQRDGWANYAIVAAKISARLAERRQSALAKLVAESHRAS